MGIRIHCPSQVKKCLPPCSSIFVVCKLKSLDLSCESVVGGDTYSSCTSVVAICKLQSSGLSSRSVVGSLQWWQSVTVDVETCVVFSSVVSVGVLVVDFVVCQMSTMVVGSIAGLPPLSNWIG